MIGNFHEVFNFNMFICNYTKYRIQCQGVLCVLLNTKS